MPERVGLAEGSWDGLYDFLDPTRAHKRGPDRDDEAQARCLEIMRKLVCFFAGRGCRDAEDLATDTILRVAEKCGSVDVSGYDDRTGYFYGVAHNLLHEWVRDSLRDSRKREMLSVELTRLPIPDPGSWRKKEAADRCLERCMTKLTERARRLIKSYYSGEGIAKVEDHRTLADEFGKSVNALRIEVHRIRKALRQCVFRCLCAEPQER